MKAGAPHMRQILSKIQVNIPFTMLYESYLPRFLEQGINPEIGFDATALDRFSMGEIEEVAEQIRKQGLSTTLHAPYLDLSPGSLDSEIRSLTKRRFQQVLEVAPIFQPKTIVCHTGYDEKRYWGLKEMWLEKSLELWRWLSQEIKKQGSVLMLENVYEQSPQEFLDVYEGLNDQDVGFCLDTGHMAAFSLEDLSTWLQSLGEHIQQLHLHDNLGSQDDHLGLGEGQIDFKLLFEYLKGRKTDPPIVTIEPHREEDLWPSLEYLEKFWPW
jgi:sugar phosphate isomerase/epimerase